MSKDEKISETDSICAFNTLIYNNTNEIILLEENFFNQFALNGQTHNYKIKLSHQSNIKKVFIDIMTYVGDVEINTYFPEEVKFDQYAAINKIFISVKINDNIMCEELRFSVTGKRNTYYSILINFGKENVEDSFITNKLQTGMYYLATIDPKKSDEISYGEKIDEQIPFMVNFYSLNCEIEVSQIVYDIEHHEQIIKYQPTSQFEHFLYDIIYPNSKERYLSTPYDYRIHVIEPDYSDYKGNLCKIYTSSIEISEKHEEYTRDILIPDNTRQQVMFSKEVKHISFGYIHVNHNKNDLLIKFITKHKAQYLVKIFYEYEESSKRGFTIVTNEMLYLENSEWKDRCKDETRVCYIQLDITLVDTIDINNPVLEFSIKSMDSNTVNYIPKNDLKIDYVQNNIFQYYYTEIGADEMGFIIVNFLRGSGKVLARIVDMKLKRPETGANWRGKYRLPNKEDETTLIIDSFTKKLEFNTERECYNGCYLLLSVFSDVKGENKNFIRNYPYSIIVHSYPQNNLNKPIINIPLDEYIIGSVNQTNLYQYYSVWLNDNAYKVIIDFQSDAGGILINVGKIKPTFQNAHFSFPPMGKDVVHTLLRSEILRYADDSFRKLNTFKDIVLTIGVYAIMIDSIYITPFSFAIRIDNDDNDDIYKVNSDHKVLCDSKSFGHKFRCAYIIKNDFIHNFNNDLIIYADLQDKSASFDIYAKFVNSVDYEMEKIKIKRNYSRRA